MRAVGVDQRTAPTLDPDVEALERILARLRGGSAGSPMPRARSTYELAKAMYRERREREAMFGCDLALFGEPSWDMLLDLFIAHAEEKRVSISSACIASAVPPTTALRWIDSLLRHGIVERTKDPIDGRRAFLDLTARGVDIMERFFRQQIT